MSIYNNTAEDNLYSTLGLSTPRSGQYFSAQQIRAAFRHALLLHHPDKAASIGISRDASTTKSEKPSRSHSVDDICRARDVLLDPVQRKQYDRALARSAALFPPKNTGTSNGSLSTSLQVEAVDLDDMDYDAAAQTWTRECRCGNAKAYEVSEEDLAGAMAQGYREISVGCDGCSLHIRVLFEVAEEAENIETVEEHDATGT